MTLHLTLSALHIKVANKNVAGLNSSSTYTRVARHRKLANFFTLSHVRGRPWQGHFWNAKVSKSKLPSIVTVCMAKEKIQRVSDEVRMVCIQVCYNIFKPYLAYLHNVIERKRNPLQ